MIELLGGIANLQYNHRPLMPDLYIRFTEMDPLAEINPACELAMKK